VGPVNLATIHAVIIAAIKDGLPACPEGHRDHTTPAEYDGQAGGLYILRRWLAGEHDVPS
jgi:hypothetical protein